MVVAILMIANFQDNAFLSLFVSSVALAYGYISYLELEELLVISMGFSFYLQFTSTNFSYFINFSPSFIVLILIWSNPGFWRGLVCNKVLRKTVGVWLTWAMSIAIVIALSLAANQVSIAFGNLAEIAKLLVAALFGLTVAVITLSSRAEDRLRLTQIWVLSASIISIVMLVIFVSYTRFPNSILKNVVIDENRLSGTFEDPNLFAVYLLLSLGGCLFLAMRNRRWWTAVPVAVVTTALSFTNSRAALVALGALALYGVILLRKNHQFVARFALLSGGSLIVFMTARPLADLVQRTLDRLIAAPRPSAHDGQPFVETLNTPPTPSVHDGQPFVSLAREEPVFVDIRLNLWETALQNWVGNPIFGIGYGEFARSAVADADGKLLSEAGILVHNTFLSMLAESGVLGFVLFTGPVLAVFWISWSRMNFEIAVVSATFLSSVAMMNAYNLQNSVLVWFAFAVLVGLIATSYSDQLRDSRRTRLGFPHDSPA